VVEYWSVGVLETAVPRLTITPVLQYSSIPKFETASNYSLQYMDVKHGLAGMFIQESEALLERLSK